MIAIKRGETGSCARILKRYKTPILFLTLPRQSRDRMVSCLDGSHTTDMNSHSNLFCLFVCGDLGYDNRLHTFSLPARSLLLLSLGDGGID